MAEVKQGDKWGALECTFSGGVKIITDDDGNEVESDEGEGFFMERSVHCYVLRCECGKEWREQQHKFRGKRLIRDCGCGTAVKGRARMVSISVPDELREQIEEQARVDKVGVSYMWVTLVRWGLERKEKGVRS